MRACMYIRGHDLHPNRLHSNQELAPDLMQGRINGQHLAKGAGRRNQNHPRAMVGRRSRHCRSNPISDVAYCRRFPYTARLVREVVGVAVRRGGAAERGSTPFPSGSGKSAVSFVARIHADLIVRAVSSAPEFHNRRTHRYRRLRLRSRSDPPHPACEDVSLAYGCSKSPSVFAKRAAPASLLSR